MGSILGDPNAKFDDGRGSSNGQNPPRQQQQPQQPQYNNQQYQQQQPQYGGNMASQQQFQPQFNSAAQNKAINQNSNIFDYSNLHQNIPRAQGNQNHTMSYSRQVAQSQNRSDIFNEAPEAPKQNRPNNIVNSSTGRQQPPQGYGQPQYQQQQQQQQYQQQQYQQPQQQQQQQGQVHTSVKVRAPPGGRSSITFG